MITKLRKLVLKQLEKYGKTFRGSVLHVGSANDPYRYRRFFPQASRYRSLDKRKSFKTDIIADIQNMPQVPSKSEECIIATFMLYQVPHVTLALSEFKRVLKPQGTLFATFTKEMGAYRIRKFTHREALALVKRRFKVKEAYQRDIGTLIIAVKDVDNVV